MARGNRTDQGPSENIQAREGDQTSPPDQGQAEEAKLAEQQRDRDTIEALETLLRDTGKEFDAIDSREKLVVFRTNFVDNKQLHKALTELAAQLSDEPKAVWQERAGIVLRELGNALADRETKLPPPEQLAGETPPERNVAKGAFCLKHPRMVNGHVAGGTPIRDGIGYTDNAALAHASQESGCEVFRTATGEAAWPKDEPAEKQK